MTISYLLLSTPKQFCLLLMVLFHVSSFSCVSGQCLDDQRSLLLQLKNTLIYNSSLSTKLVYWNHHVDCCNWNGVECDRFGHVIALELDNETISGGIENSSALYSFQYLENLNLAYNNFNVSLIPRELGNMTNLARLNLSYAGFAGQIPVELSQMTSLVMLDISSNELEYPNFKNFVQNLTRLEELYLDLVDFTQKEDWWEALSLAQPNLRSLSLRYCGLSGHLNSSFLQLQTLSVIRLDGNNLSDTSLDFFANFRNLAVLSLSNCSLQGSFPGMIFQVPTLQKLDLSYNRKLGGTLPEFLPGGSGRESILGGTNFSGSPADSIISLHNLSIIDIRNCNFTGPIPFTIGNLSKLVNLNFAGNSFTGSIPIFSMSNKLEHIDLRYNKLNGSLSSSHFEGLSNLQFLDIGNNSLTGNIPTFLFSLPSLQSLQLSDNNFTGQVNEFSVLKSSLRELDLSRNQLEGPIPKSFFRLEKLYSLQLSFNFFNGTIPFEDFQTFQSIMNLGLGNNHLSVNVDIVDSESYSFPQLQYLDLASCNLSRFPNLMNQTRMYGLDLSDNKISGDIPSWIWEVGNELMGLSTLNLSHNCLMNVQTPYRFPSSLKVLDLHSNMLQGELPMITSFRYVDYSNNHFHGHIPSGMFISNAILSNFVYTRTAIVVSHGLSRSFFSVANNSLTGEIPISICNVTHSELIDMSDNLLSGGLPPCLLQNLTYLGVLNMRRNKISGNIPDTFPGNCSLSTLDLSSNNLRGNIPPSLANCKSLQVMNVASNNLKGAFPCILRNSSSLHVLVLRSNKFSGDIKCHGFGHDWINLQIIDIAFNNFTGFVDPGFISSLTGMKLKNSPRLTGDPLGFQSREGNNYLDTVTVTVKGLELEIVKILTILTSIDFSSNKFQGAIPETFGELISLYALNLSHNSFTGIIPRSIGNLKHLESLDLSANQLTGQIPTELTTLSFLSFFDVSYNKLIGRIPSGRQFQTFSAAIYEGNTRLCGSPTNQSCDFSVGTETSTTSTGEKDVDWMFILAGLGYATGVAFVVVPPLFSRRWGDKWEEFQSKFLKLIYPKYRD